ncbi:MAG: hypothetical protein N4A45_00620, partial [Flavobacteriales bacterium]|nr:hypothetical protein [Flavobacteriales bacterium]
MYYFKLLFISLCALSFSNLFGQGNYEYLDINNQRIPLQNDGRAFLRLTGLPEGSKGFEESQIPKGSNRSTIFSQDLWLGALLSDSSIKVSGELTYSKIELGKRKAGISDSERNTSSKKAVWKIYRQEIIKHRKQYKDPEYIMHESILNWPAKKSTDIVNEDELAPFQDMNNNGYYDPENGDFPLIRGEQAVFTIFHYDDPNNSNALNGVQVNLMLYGFINRGTILDDIIFANYKIINKNKEDFLDFRLGNLNNYSLGQGVVRQIASDSTTNSFFAYNQKFLSPNNGVDQTPVYGVRSLSNTLDYSFSLRRITNSPIGIPQTKEDFWNYLNGRFKDSTTIADHYQSHESNKFMYPVGKNWTIPGYSLEFNVGIHNLGALPAGESTCIDMAYILASNTQKSTPKTIEKFRKMAAGVKTIYDYDYSGCYDTDEFWFVGNEEYS